MDYLDLYKRSLQNAYGVEFPGMSSDEFDRRCSLKIIPIALKALYMALGTQRICRMHCLIPMPEELIASGDVVIVHQENDRVWAVSLNDLSEDNPLILARTGIRTEEGGTDVWEFGNDGETRLAKQMEKLIAYSALSTRKIQKDTEKGAINEIMNITSWISGKYQLHLNLVALVLVVILIQARIPFVLNDWNPVLGGVSSLFISVMMLIPLCSLGHYLFYWDVLINWFDPVRFVSSSDSCFQLIRDLTYHYLRWNRPDFFFNRGPGKVDFHAEVALGNGKTRFCQSRYEVIMGKSGSLNFPDMPPIFYAAEKQTSILMRTTLDDSGCLCFVHVNANCSWRLPRRHRLEFQIQVTKDTLQEDMAIKVGSPDLVPTALQDFLFRKCSDFTGIKKAWCTPAVMDGSNVYLLSVMADGEVDMQLLVREAFKRSNRPINGVILSDEEAMKSTKPLYTRGQKQDNMAYHSSTVIKI